MKLNFFGILLILFSLNSFAEEIISFGKPFVSGPTGTIGDARSVDAKSDLDGVCLFLGSNKYVKGSVVTSRERFLYNCSVSTFDNGIFAFINSDGRVEKIYRADYFETLNSRLGRIRCSEYKTRQKIIQRIKCIKN